MSVLHSIQSALSSVGFPVGLGKFPDLSGLCAKVVFTNAEPQKSFLGGGKNEAENFRVILRGSDYYTLEQSFDSVKAALKGAGFIQIGGYEDVESESDEAFMQLAVDFKFIQ